MAELWVNLERGKKAGGERARKRRTRRPRNMRQTMRGGG